jgi:hypothetical protein
MFSHHFCTQTTQFTRLKRAARDGQQRFSTVALERRKKSRTKAFEEWFRMYVNLNGDYMPHEDKIHLNPGKWRWLWSTYVRDMEHRGYSSISYPTFLNMRKAKFGVVHIPPIKRFSKCDTCSDFVHRISHTFNAQQKKLLEIKYDDHTIWQQRERAKYYKHREKSTTYPEKYLSVIIDGMDQSKLELPRFLRTRSAFANLFRLRMALVGALTHGHQPGASAYLFPCDFPKDSSTTVQVVFNVLSEVKSLRESGRLPPVVYLQLDNTTRENKNKTMLAALFLLVLHGHVRKIKLSFLPKGHTHEDIDSFFSDIAKILIRCAAYTPMKLKQLIMRCKGREPTVHDLEEVR